MYTDTCMHAHPQTHMCARTVSHTCTNAHAYIHVLTHTHVSMWAHRPTFSQACTFKHKHRHMHTHTLICASAHVHMCTHILIGTHLHMKTHKNTHMQTSPHTRVFWCTALPPSLPLNTTCSYRRQKPGRVGEGGELTLRSLWTTPIWWQWRTASRICWMQ